MEASFYPNLEVERWTRPHCSAFAEMGKVPVQVQPRCLLTLHVMSLLDGPHLRELGLAAPPPPSLSLRHSNSTQGLVMTRLRWWGVPSLSGTRNHEPRRGWEQKKKTTLGGSLSLEAAGSRCPTGPSRDCSLRSKHHLWFEGCGFYAVEMEAVGMAAVWSQDVLLLSLWSGTSPPHAEPVPSPLCVTPIRKTVGLKGVIWTKCT